MAGARGQYPMRSHGRQRELICLKVTNSASAHPSVAGDTGAAVVTRASAGVQLVTLNESYSRLNVCITGEHATYTADLVDVTEGAGVTNTITIGHSFGATDVAGFVHHLQIYATK